MVEKKRKLYRETNLKIIFSITLIAVLGVSSITPAFPNIINAFNITPQSIGLLITAFTLPGVFLTPVLGVLADRWGRKKILVPSLFLFGIAGVACTFIRDYSFLVAMRFFQGVGAASLGSLNVTLIGDLYSGHERGTVMGYNASVLSVGTASYPAIGGAVAMLGWYYPFLLPVLAIPVGLLVIFFLKNPEPDKSENLKQYLANVWKSINLKVVGIFIASVITFIILYGSYLTFYPLLIGHSFQESSFTIGIIMSTMSITTGVTATQLGRLMSIFPKSTLLKIAFALYALSLVLTPNVPNIWVLLIPAVIFGVAQGVNIPTLQTLLADLAPMEHRAAFMSMNGMVLRLGQTLGPILIGVFYGLWGIDAAFYAGGVLAVIMILLIFLFIKEKREIT